MSGDRARIEAALKVAREASAKAEHARTTLGVIGHLERGLHKVTHILDGRDTPLPQDEAQTSQAKPVQKDPSP